MRERERQRRDRERETDRERERERETDRECMQVCASECSMSRIEDCRVVGRETVVCEKKRHAEL